MGRLIQMLRWAFEAAWSALAMLWGLWTGADWTRWETGSWDDDPLASA